MPLSAILLQPVVLVSLSGMIETPRLQAKQEFDCSGATCHSGQRAGIHEKGL